MAPVAVKTTSNQCAGGGGVLQVGQDLQRCVFFSVSHRFEEKKTHRDPSEGPQIKKIPGPRRYRKKHTHTCFFVFLFFGVHVGGKCAEPQAGSTALSSALCLNSRPLHARIGAASGLVVARALSIAASRGQPHPPGRRTKRETVRTLCHIHRRNILPLSLRKSSKTHPQRKKSCRVCHALPKKTCTGGCVARGRARADYNTRRTGAHAPLSSATIGWSHLGSWLSP